MTDHVDVGTLAMFREGLLPGDEAAAVGAHLADCDRCRQADTSLTHVTGLLAAAPAPPMPPGLSARIEAAIATEAAARAAGRMPQPGGSAPRRGRRPGAGTGPGAGRPPRQAARGLARSRAALRAMAAAAVIAVIGGTGYAVSQLTGQGSPASSGGSSAGSPVPGPAASRLGAPAAGMAPDRPAGSLPAAVPAVFSGTDYTRRHFSNQLQASLRRYPAGSRQRWPAAGERPLPASAIAGCVNAVTHGQRPRLVDVARYQGTPAMIIVVTGHGSTPARAWVVAPDCSAGHQHVRLRVTLPGPR